eukprot:GSMAST32.ASY1.ANO1.2257.1 assembled CDS
MGNEGSISNSEKSDLTLLSRQLRWCVSKCLGGEADSQYVRACQMSLPSVSKKVNTKNSSSLKNRGERETSATHPTLQLLDKIASFAGIWHHSGDAVSKDDQRSHTEGSIHVHLHHHHYHHYQEQVGSGIVSSSRTSSTVNSRRVPSSAECSTSAASLGWGFGPLWEKVKAVVSSVASANGRSDLQQRIAVEAAVALPGYIIHHCNLGNSILPENFRLGGISIDMTRSHRHRLNSDHIKDAMAPLLLNLYHSKFNRDIFNRPVDPVALNIPDYPSVIERPMDLGTIRSKMERGLYSTLLALRADVELVFSNAMLYNAAYHPVHKLAENLLAQFQSEYFKAAAKFNQLYRRSFRHTCAHCHDGMTCALCHMKCLRLEHSSVACDGPCGGRVARSAYYFVELSTNKTWCVKCHSRMRMSSPDGTPHSKRRNNNVYAEPWVHCSICKNWYHQACVLFNPWKEDDNIQKKITSKSYRRKTKKLKSMEEKSPKINLDNSDTFGPKYRNNKLKRTSSNVSIESKSSQTSAVQQPQYHENPVSEEIRDIMESMSSLRKRQYLAQENESKANSEKKIYNTNVVPSSFTCRTKTLLVFQKIDGIDVLLFAAYFNEFGSESPEPNRRVVYLDYIDSVNLLSPRWLRTPLYQMILTEYLASAKERGFSAMHIWACPPLRGTDYIFHRHPRDQRTPGWDRLRQWYSSMLVSAQKDGSVVEVQSLYADHFDGLVPLRPNHNPPFLPGHFWLQSALELIKKDSIVRSKGKRKAKRILSTTNIRVGSSTTKTDEAPRKKSRITRISEETSIDQPSDTSHITGDKSFSTASDCDAILPEILPSSTLLSEQATSTMLGMSEVKEEEKEEIRESRLKYLQTKTFTEELRTKIGSMAERLLVVRLQPICGDCGDYIHENFGKGHESYICMGGASEE